MRQGFKFVNPNEKTELRLRHSFTRLKASVVRWTRSRRSASTRASTSTSRALEKTHRELSRALHPDKLRAARARASGGPRSRRRST